MDIKDIQRAMDDMPMGDGSAFAEIAVGPSKHEQFLDRHYRKLALGLCACAAVVAGIIVYNGVNDATENEAAAALVAAMPESSTLEITTDEQGLKNVTANYAETRAAVTADYLQAISLWKSGKKNEGVEKMKAFIDAAPSDEWRAQASVALACHYMSEGKKEDAVALFRSVVDSGNPTFSGFAMLCLGDLARGMKDDAAAGNYYRDLNSKFSDSAFSSKTLPVYKQREELFGIQAPTYVTPAAAPTETGDKDSK